MFIADLGIRVASTTVKTAEDRLKKLVVQGPRAERAVKGVGDASDKASGGVGRLAKGVGGLIAAVGVMNLGTQFVSQGRATSKALAEVTTLIEGTAEQQRQLTEASEEFVKKFGGSVAGQLQGFYGTISAGASSVEEAITTMETANKLAKGGVTDVATAVDGLTTILNVYGDAAGGAMSVSDAMFVAMKAGKTTIGELSSSIGAVAPLASEAGVSIEELLSATAALTKGGITTSESMTGLRAIMAAVVKPSQEATELAKALGIEFNTAGLQAKGFGGFMDDLVEKTGGSSDALAILFGGIEATVPALSLAGKAGEYFNETMEGMEARAGATDEAVRKIADSLDERLNQAMNRYTVYGDAAGEMLLTVMVPALETLNKGIDVLVANSDLLGAAFVGLAATQIPALVTGVTGLVKGMQVAAGAAKAMGVAVTLAGGPIGLLVGLLAGGAAYWLLFRDNAKHAETGMYNAAEGTKALNEALGVFHTTAAPSAGQSAIELANNNYKLAQSALAAAEAELARKEAFLDQSNKVGRALTGEDSGFTGMEEEGVKGARAAVERQRKALEQAKLEMDRAAREVTSSMGSGGEGGTLGVLTPELVVPDIQAILDSLDDTTDAASGTGSALDKLADAAKRVFEDTRTPMEQYNIELAKLKELLAGDYINDDTYARAVAQLDEELRKATEGMQKYSDGIESAAGEFAGLILQQQSWEDFATNSINRFVQQQIEGRLAKALQELVDSFGGGVVNGQGGGWIGKAINALFGSGSAPSYDGGGDTGSGSRTGGVDGKGGFFGILHPNETVTDHTKGGNSGGRIEIALVGGDLTLTDNGSITTNVRAVVAQGAQATEAKIRQDVRDGRGLARDLRQTTTAQQRLATR